MYRCTKDTNEPFSFKAGVKQVITGWDQGCLGMTVGETRCITAVPSLIVAHTAISNTSVAHTAISDTSVAHTAISDIAVTRTAIF